MKLFPTNRRKDVEVNSNQVLLLLIEALVGRLATGVGSLHRLAGISYRQACYWTTKGYLPGLDPNEAVAHYGYRSILLAWAIASFKRQGYTLESSAQRANEFLEKQRAPADVIESNKERPERLMFFHEDWRRIGEDSEATAIEIALAMLESDNRRILPMREPSKPLHRWKKLLDPKPIFVVSSDWITLSPELIFIFLGMITKELVLSPGPTAHFIGCSCRQLTYWSDRQMIEQIDSNGNIPDEHEDGDPRYYDFAQIVRGLIIQVGRRRRVTLERASKQASRIAPIVIADWQQISDEYRTSPKPQPLQVVHQNYYGLVIKLFLRRPQPLFTAIEEGRICEELRISEVHEIQRLLADLGAMSRASVLDRLPTENSARYRLLPGYKPKLERLESTL